VKVALIKLQSVRPIALADSKALAKVHGLHPDSVQIPFPPVLKILPIN